jgi:hypothetical protein
MKIRVTTCFDNRNPEVDLLDSGEEAIQHAIKCGTIGCFLSDEDDTVVYIPAHRVTQVVIEEVKDGGS